MAKKRSADAYGKLVRILIVLFVLTVICGAGYMLLDQSIKAQEAENAALAQQENDRLKEAYNQAKAEEQAAASQVETPEISPYSVCPMMNPLKERLAIVITCINALRFFSGKSTFTTRLNCPFSMPLPLSTNIAKMKAIRKSPILPILEILSNDQ